jgi:hypothetical protein
MHTTLLVAPESEIKIDEFLLQSVQQVLKDIEKQFDSKFLKSKSG